MIYVQKSLLLSILLVPTVFFAAEKPNFESINNTTNNDFKKQMCASAGLVPAFLTLKQFSKSGYTIPQTILGSMTTFVGTYFICSKVANIDDPFEDFSKIYKN